MRLIKFTTVEEWMARYPDAAGALAQWAKVVHELQWQNLAELRQTYRTADQVTVASGRPVVVFNIRGNRYRLVAAVHYDRQRVFAMLFLTHAEYSKDRWKGSL